MKANYQLLAALLALTVAFATAGYAKDRHAKSKGKALKPLPAGPAWADTNKDGQLSDEELQRAAQILKDKIKKAEADHKNL